MTHGIQRRIAVVDDEEGVRKGLERLLRSAGYAPVAFPSGEKFLQSIESIRPDLVILDLRMPGMDGLEVMGGLAAGEREVPVIVLTSFPSEEVRLRASRAGALAFLEKPVERSVLLTAIEAALVPDSRERPA